MASEPVALAERALAHPDDPDLWEAALAAAAEESDQAQRDGVVAQLAGLRLRLLIEAARPHAWPPVAPAPSEGAFAARLHVELAWDGAAARECGFEDALARGEAEALSALELAKQVTVEALPSAEAVRFVARAIETSKREPVPEARRARLAEWRALAGEGVDDVFHLQAYLNEWVSWPIERRCFALARFPLHCLGRLELARRAWERGAPPLPLLLVESVGASLLLPPLGRRATNGSGEPLTLREALAALVGWVHDHEGRVSKTVRVSLFYSLSHGSPPPSSPSRVLFLCGNENRADLDRTVCLTQGNHHDAQCGREKVHPLLDSHGHVTLHPVRELSFALHASDFTKRAMKHVDRKQ